MSCDIVENKISKCYPYYPRKNETNSGKINNEEKETKKYKIKLLSEKNVGKNLTERVFILQNPEKRKKKVAHLHFKNWPDHGVPDIIENFETFEILNNYIYAYRKRYDSPVLIHCSAGVGRTGTLISLFYIFYITKKNMDENKLKFDINVFNYVRKLKEERRFTVQSHLQYDLLYKFSYIWLKKMALKFKNN